MILFVKPRSNVNSTCCRDKGVHVHLSQTADILEQNRSWTWEALQEVSQHLGELLHRRRIPETTGGSSLSENEECHDDECQTINIFKILSPVCPLSVFGDHWLWIFKKLIGNQIVNLFKTMMNIYLTVLRHEIYFLNCIYFTVISQPHDDCTWN